MKGDTFYRIFRQHIWSEDRNNSPWLRHGEDKRYKTIARAIREAKAYKEAELSAITRAMAFKDHPAYIGVKMKIVKVTEIEEELPEGKGQI